MTTTHSQLLDKAFQLAVSAHAGQVDKSGQAYIAHVVRVLAILERNGEDIQTQALGLVHDVIEDSDYSLYYVQKCLEVDDKFIEDLRLLTRTDDVTYQEYIDKICTSVRAAKVKAADIEDHFRDCSHVSESLKERYKKAYGIVLTKIWGHNHD